MFSHLLILTNTSWSFNVPSASGVVPYKIVHHQQNSPWELQGKVTWSHFHGCKSTYWRMESHLLLAMAPSNLPAVWVWTRKRGLCNSRPIQKPDPLPHGGANQNQYLSTCGLCLVWPDRLGPLSGFPFWVSLFIIAIRYVTVKNKIVTMVRRWQFWMYWPPWWSKQSGTHTLQHPENAGQRSLNNGWSCIVGNLGGNTLHVVRNLVLATILDNRESETHPTPSWKSASTIFARASSVISVGLDHHPL